MGDSPETQPNDPRFVDRTRMAAIIARDVARSIPYVGDALALAETINSWKQTFLAERIRASFLHLDSPRLEKWKKKVIDNPTEAKKCGELLIFTLDRITDSDKAEILGEVFTAFVEGAITFDDLSRLAQAIDLATLSDLSFLLQTPPSREPSRRNPSGSQSGRIRGSKSEGAVEKRALLQYLVPSGLTESEVRFDGVSYQPSFRISPLGQLLKKCHDLALNQNAGNRQPSNRSV